MPVDDRFRQHVSLLVRVLPCVTEEKCFALKGGTAINLFVCSPRNEYCNRGLLGYGKWIKSTSA